MRPFVLFVLGILVALGLLIALAIAVGPVLTGVAVPRLGVILFTVGLVVLICWLIAAAASSLGLSSRQRLAVTVLSGALVGVLALVLFWRPVASA